MKIFIHELTDQETELDFTQEEAWVRDSVERVDERTDGQSGVEAIHDLLPKKAAPAKKPPERSVQAHFSLRKVDDVVVVNGSIQTEIHLLCSRCAAPFQFETSPRFSALFCKDPVMAGIGHLESQQGVSKPAG